MQPVTDAEVAVKQGQLGKQLGTDRPQLPGVKRGRIRQGSDESQMTIEPR